MLDCDAHVGEMYRLTLGRREVDCTFIEQKRSGKLIFENCTTGRKFPVGESEFLAKRHNGFAIRVRHLKNGLEAIGFDPRVVEDPNEALISKTERKARQDVAWRLERARTLCFYANGHDQQSGQKSVPRLLRELRKEARREGFQWEPSKSTLLRALEVGEKGNRTVLAYYEDYFTHEPTAHWPPAILQLKEEAIRDFYTPKSGGTIRICDATNTFLEKVDLESQRRVSNGLPPLERPDRETVRLWIHKAATAELYTRKWGKRAGMRRYHGTSPSIQAERILERVIFDATRVDTWAPITDEAAETILKERPWLTIAVDVKSTMLLAGILTFEPPSLLTIMEALKQVVRRKDFLIARYGYHKGATDGYGKIGTAVVDNAWENTGTAFQASCENVGISVEWAPVKTPEYKALCERLFKTFNDAIWHRMKSGIAYKPSEMSLRGLAPEKEAGPGIEVLQDLFWDFVVTCYHVEAGSGVGRAPAQEWRDGVAKGHRHLVDDTNMVDRLFGGVRHGSLTTHGITYERHRFHDTVQTSGLLDALLRYSKAREQRNTPLSTGTVKVQFTFAQSDCSFIDVWDYHRKRLVRLPNVDAKFSAGCSWRTAELVREYAERENLAFHTDQEKCAARAAFRRRLESEARSGPYREARKKARAYHSEMRLVPGDTIVESFDDPSVTGMDGCNLFVDLPMKYREDEGFAAKSFRRGGKKATRASVRARQRKAAKAKLPSHNVSAPSVEIPRAPTMVEDSNAALRCLAEDLD